MSMTKYAVAGVLALMLAGAGVATSAEDETINIRITERMPFAEITHEGKTVRIQRIQDEENVITGGFARTSRKCPPFCVHPMEAAPGVVTVGELEVIEFVRQYVEKNTGVLVDARTPEWFGKGTIPGSVNLPFTMFEKPDNDPELIAVLEQVGVKSRVPGFFDKLVFKIKSLLGMRVSERALGWNFSKAKELLLWCNGPWCDQSPRAIRNLISIGYPVEKLRYYRGGMQDWQILGLTVVVP